MKLLLAVIFMSSAYGQTLLSGVLASSPTVGGTVATPTDSNGGGCSGASPTWTACSGTVVVTLSCATSGCVICYRNDGTNPAATTPGTCDAGSTTYSGTFSLTVTTTVKALGTKVGMTNSGILSSSYTFPGGSSCTPYTGYAHCRTLTFDHTQAGTADTSDFVAVTKNASGLMLLGSSRLQQSDCSDVAVTSDLAGTTLIPWRVEAGTCNQSTGQVGIWTQMALSHTADSKVYVSYDKASSLATSPASVYPTRYKMDYDMRDGTTLSVTDATTNASNPSGVSSTTAAAGMIGGALSNAAGQTITFTGSGPSAITAMAGNSSLCYEFWFKQAVAGANMGFVNMVGGSGGLPGFGIAFGTYFIGNRLDTSSLLIGPNTIPSDTNWHHFVGSWTSANTTVYVDGGVVATDSTSNGVLPTFSGLMFMLYDGSNAAVGLVDEMRVSNTSCTASWVTASYNNQKSGTTMLTVGSEI